MGEVVLVLTAFIALIVLGSLFVLSSTASQSHLFIKVLTLARSVIITTKWFDKNYHPKPRAFERAKKKLCGVVTDENQPEGTTDEHVNCPICMDKLFSTTPKVTGSSTTATEKEKEVDNSPAKTQKDVNPGESSRAGGASPTPVIIRPIEKAVSLKACHHIFHERCLEIWFMMQRFDCPVCRTMYWDDGKGKGLKGNTPDTREVTQTERQPQTSPNASQWAGMIV